MVSLDWANSLLGRDWEIFWNDSEENEAKDKTTDTKTESEEVDTKEEVKVESTVESLEMSNDFANKLSPSKVMDLESVSGPVMMELDLSLDKPKVVDNPSSEGAKVETMNTRGKSGAKKEERKQLDEANEMDVDEEEENEFIGDESESEGSIIDDWYAGRVLSFSSDTENTFTFKVHFVGDEEIYEMVLDPSKVRPSARGWIKRTKAMLNCSQIPTDDQIPPDSSMAEDKEQLHNIQNEIDSKQYKNIIIPDHIMNGVNIPTMEDLTSILRFRYLLKSQIHLRSRLSKIENHHGSTKYTDGERNPTEAYVNHLVQCCKDLDLACDWFCRCWDLFVLIFTEKPNVDEWEARLKFDRVLSEYLESGKHNVENCLSMDTENINSKRRQAILSVPTPRKKKRRRKNGGSSHSILGFTMDEIYMTPHEFLQNFSWKENNSNTLLKPFGQMLQALSYYIVGPTLEWKHKVGQLLGDEDDKEEGSTIDLQNNMFDDATSIDSVDESDFDESGEKEAKYYNNTVVLDCMNMIGKSPVLDAFNWEVEFTNLEKKSNAISSIEKRVLELLYLLGDESGAPSENDDKVLKGLESVMEDITSRTHPVFNINPLGVDDGSPITREVLEGAIKIRKWLLDVRHIEYIHERVAFIEDLASRYAKLPAFANVPEIQNNEQYQSVFAKAEMKVKSMAEGISAQISSNDVKLWPLDQNPTFASIQGVDAEIARQSNRLNHKSAIILPIQEKLAIRRDILLWRQKYNRILLNGGDRIDFSKLDGIHNELQSIKKGQSNTRIELVKDLYPNEQLEAEIEKFASRDVVLVCGEIVEDLSVNHHKATQWKTRSEAVIMSLRMHRNTIAGDEIVPQKLPPMVDIKRINDLIEDYATLRVQVPSCIEILEKIKDASNQWALNLYENILHKEIPIQDCLQLLQEQRPLRPKGIIIDPSRHVYEALVDLLFWYQQVEDSMKKAAERISMAAVESTSEDSTGKIYSTLMVDSFYPLLVEGIEVVKAYADSIEFPHSFDASVQILDDLGYKRSTRAVILEKIQPHPFGSIILSRMYGIEADMSEGYPLFTMLWFEWHLLVGALVSRCEHINENGNRREIKSPSLTEATKLMSLEPSLKDIPPSDSTKVSPFLQAKTFEMVKLERMIFAAESAEHNMRIIISKSKELLKGGLQNADLVQQHLVELKDLQTTFKTHTRSRECLSLDSAIEPQIDLHVKAFTWFIRTFSYSFLHLDEASYSAQTEKDSIKRVPWDVIVSLHERLPCDDSIHVGAFALVILRVRELFETGKKWQDEISRTTTITKRGGKRRVPGGTAKKEEDPEVTARLQMETLKKLAEHPILLKVAMPREKAVRDILESSKEFEIQLHNFLGQDYDGTDSDRAKYPKSDSLVGNEGEFILYRLTGSPLFVELQSKIHNLSQIAENVLAETPGKATFEWIMGAVTWIQDLAAAVTTESPFRETSGKILVIPQQEGNELVSQGESIFLNVPDDLKSTLSKHGIFVTTNQQEKTMKVTVKKDGSHHSCGATVIRWCPILFECLKTDVKLSTNWIIKLKAVINQFQAYHRANCKNQSEEINYQYFCFREKIGGMLDLGQDSLVITPSKNFVDSMQNLMNVIQVELAKKSNKGMNELYAERWFAESSSLMPDRSFLLESLSYRKSIASGQTDAPSGELLEFRKTFRDTCRSYLERAFGRSLKACGVTLIPELQNLDALCAQKSWEIESVMFERFQGDYGTSRLSDGYRDKARNLRTSLEQKDNVSLCLRVILGEIDSTTLVNMSSEELASHKAKMDREKAKQDARSSTLLTPRLSTSQISSMLGSQVESNPDSSKVTPEPKNGSGSIDYSPKETSESVAASSTSLRTSDRTSVNLKPPPPPPALVQSFGQPIDNNDPRQLYNPARDMGKRFTSSTGGDRFKIVITNPRLTFSVALYLEDDVHAGLKSLVPDTLTQKGRLAIGEFSRFLFEKLSSARWAAAPLRLTTLSDYDEQEYRTFYKDYEGRKRIAMFSLSQNTKLFLVPPKFHSAAKSTGYISLPDKNSTYAIVLTKETYFVD